ncbi:hypothetical protein E6H16_10355 [Candidatus Bathyarchaeota archaeon]|nr:MAG: hypothetical protein E6H16_10355 [Candidatus Bathyarchaeota archaeon]
MAGILFVIGVYVIYPPLPVSDNLAANIPTGNYYYRISFSIVKENQISGTYSVTGGTTVNVYIFTAGQFDLYRTSQSTSNIFQATGSGGSFSATVSTPGTYYLVFDHAANNNAQDVQITYLRDGWNPIFLGTGVALIAVGIALGIFGNRQRRKQEAPRKATDVVMFDQPKT